jgi:predicted alpha/beta hydrolase
VLKLQIGFLRFLNYGLRKTCYQVFVSLGLAITRLGLAITTFYGKSGGWHGWQDRVHHIFLVALMAFITKFVTSVWSRYMALVAK